MGDTTEVLDEAVLEKSFLESLDDLQTAFGAGKTEDLKKAGDDSKSDKKAMDYDDDAEDGEKDDEDEDEEDKDMEKTEKSMQDLLEADPEAEAAMEVSSFLKSFASAFETRISKLEKMVGAETKLTKSIGTAMIATMNLSKSQKDKVDRIAEQDVKTGSLRRLNKARFEHAGGDPVEVAGPVVLEKSVTWAREGKISLTEAGIIESRVNKGILGKSGDATDLKVANLLKETA